VGRTHAMFTEGSYTSSDNKLFVRAGVRLNNFENIGNFTRFIPEPRFNMSYAISPKIKAALQGEFKHQTTAQIIDLEQNFLGIEKRRWILADDAILPITKSKQASLGLNYDESNLYIGIEGFYKEVNGISVSTQGFQNQGQFNGEIGNYDISGLELLVNTRNSTWSSWLSYAYNVNNYSFPDLDPSRFPNNLDIRHTVTFAGTYTHKQLKLGVGLNYRTGNPFTAPLDGDAALDTTTFPFSINYKIANSNRLPDYIRADASAIYTFELFQGIKATAGASVLNILNRKNILNTYFRVNTDDEIETVERVSLGVTPNASFRVFF